MLMNVMMIIMMIIVMIGVIIYMSQIPNGLCQPYLSAAS